MVLVCAPNAAAARMAAEEWALADEGQTQVGNESPSPRAGFSDEKLYSVRRAPDHLTAEHPCVRGMNKVLAAEILAQAI